MKIVYYIYAILLIPVIYTWFKYFVATNILNSHIDTARNKKPAATYATVFIMLEQHKKQWFNIAAWLTFHALINGLISTYLDYRHFLCT
jgi:hypothetical protein